MRSYCQYIRRWLLSIWLSAVFKATFLRGRKTRGLQRHQQNVAFKGRKGTTFNNGAGPFPMARETSTATMLSSLEQKPSPPPLLLLPPSPFSLSFFFSSDRQSQAACSHAISPSRPDGTNPSSLYPVGKGQRKAHINRSDSTRLCLLWVAGKSRRHAFSSL